MSGFIAAAQPQIINIKSDERLVEPMPIDPLQDDIAPVLTYDWNVIAGTPYYQNIWWPGTTGILGDDAGFGIDDMSLPVWWDMPWRVSGCNGRFAFAGITRDAFGTPLPGCTVRLYRTATNALQAIVTSDPYTGAYIATSPYNDAHFLTVHKASTPPVAGATVDTLVPA